jgi:hypothetical protein
MCTQCVTPADTLTWDDVCELWDNGVYTAEDVKSIATLFFDSPELSAVLDVIENVENDWHASNTDHGDYEPQPAIVVPIRIFECFEFESVQEFEGVQNVFEPGRESQSRRFH